MRLRLRGRTLAYAGVRVRAQMRTHTRAHARIRAKKSLGVEFFCQNVVFALCKKVFIFAKGENKKFNQKHIL